MALLLALIVFALSGCSDTTDQKTDGVPAEATEAAMDAASESIKAVGSLSREGYELEQVVVLSRHNIRAPLSGSGTTCPKKNG